MLNALIRLSWLDFLAISAAAGSVAAFLARAGWLFELASHFRVQYAVMLAVAAALYGVQRRLRPALIAAAFAAVNLAVVLPVYAAIPSAHAGGPAIRLLQFNVHAPNRSYDAVRAFIQAQEADIVVIEELSRPWQAALNALRADYPYHVESLDPADFAIGFYSRLPVQQKEILPIGGVLPSVLARLVVDGVPLTVIGTHPMPPTSPSMFAWRNRQLGELARLAAHEPGVVILVGDLNVTPWSPYFTDLLREGRLRDSRHGFGLQPSWPSWMPPLRIPIDHCLVSDGVIVSRRRVGPSVGSDHASVLIDIELEPR